MIVEMVVEDEKLLRNVRVHMGQLYTSSTEMPTSNVGEVFISDIPSRWLQHLRMMS